ncbi:hypothetical protein HHJ44_19970 [Escherichia coli]|nr:hypothetical protein HHJ44_19970 [Escherichia coli]
MDSTSSTTLGAVKCRYSCIARDAGKTRTTARRHGTQLTITKVSRLGLGRSTSPFDFFAGFQIVVNNARLNGKLAFIAFAAITIRFIALPVALSGCTSPAQRRRSLLQSAQNLHTLSRALRRISTPDNKDVHFAHLVPDGEQI